MSSRDDKRGRVDTYPIQTPISVVICSRLLHPPWKEHCVDLHCSPSHCVKVANRCSVEIGIPCWSGQDISVGVGGSTTFKLLPRVARDGISCPRMRGGEISAQENEATKGAVRDRSREGRLTHCRVINSHDPESRGWMRTTRGPVQPAETSGLHR